MIQKIKGLAPPLASKTAFYHCKKYVKQIIMVSDEEIIEACRILFEKGIKVEPSGCAGMAALLFNKIPNVDIENASNFKIVVILSGGNVSAIELANLIK